MATNYHFILLLPLFLLFSSTLSIPNTFTSFNVSSSLHSTLSLFSSSKLPNYPHHHHNPHPHPHQVPLTFTIHSRASLHAPATTHKDYKSLTESRLSRDTSHVNSLTSKAELATRGLTHASLTDPVDAELAQSDLTSPVTSGTSQGSGEYFSRVGIGSPARQYYMVIDTGSDVTWLQCNPCSDCYQQTDPVFSPSSSATYSPLTCYSQQCTSLEVSACRNSACLYQVSYGDGSYTVGNFVTETVSFGPSGSVPRVAIGCGHDNEGLFVGAAGLLGLGGGPLSLTSQLKATSFSYCLVDRDSSKTSTLEFNAPIPTGQVTTAPMLKNNRLNTFYYVGLTGFSVGGQELTIPPSLFSMDDSGSGGVIVDSGTAITRLPTQAYSSLRDAFTRLTQHLKSTTGVALFDTCYDFSSMSSVKVPTVAMHFAGGQSLNLPAKNYLIPVDSSGTFCFAFAETASSMSIIGNVQQQGTRVHFDLGRSLVAFSQNNC
ncbi:protein ASPARTIC PROTEASE IN GUARD CELL 1-like [Silene latifolia]|uniref:protein ASPARTIC PROTEASE IN GUARD CELL 1-like n=1 Tax=Silene latifolia TaxID=37657 RepID=UPI003D76E21E